MKKQQQTTAAKPGIRVGVSETVLEMAAEINDPAMWAAMQLTKPDQPPAKTIGEVRDRIAAIMATAINMEIKRRNLK